ncbi:MAG: hypothetical protein KF745_09865 [Phycisphaeraceae bacterium]|nr:hypothetical protein [Phycisphaeraceae bacterium]
MRVRAVGAAVAAWCAVAASASGQLTESQVLVVYDSRVPDSLAVAEYYAGSAKVPGGAGGVVGARPRVMVVNLANLPGAGVAPAVPDITYTQFINQFRDPLRNYLVSNNLAESVRCIVLTKGIPHRVQDITTAGLGDDPGSAGTALGARMLTYCSVDSELTLLHQNLSTGTGSQVGTFAAGLVRNPYHRITQPIGGYPMRYIRSAKSFVDAVGFGNGVIWSAASSLNQSQRLTPGDFYMVCRLDGNSVSDVKASIDRAQGPYFNTETAGIVLDEGASNGVADIPNSELDNSDTSPPSGLWAGDDYELTRDGLLADGRFAPGNVRYNAAGGAANFIVGPLVSFGGGIVFGAPLVLIASEGANHVGGVPGTAGTQYATSFNYAPGAVFNTIESYNGRALGGLGQVPGIPQQQAADFIQAGGTFAIGHVWEPFAFTLADNAVLVPAFHLGRLTWAEAAYSAIPCLSWQHVVLGDPLARAQRSRDDRDSDGQVTIDDLYYWSESPFDLNRSGAANGVDRGLMEDSLRGGEGAVLQGSQRN